MDKVVSLFWDAIICLLNVNAVPVDLVRKLIKFFQTSTVAEFNEVFCTMHINQCLKIRTYTYEDVLAIAKPTYHEVMEGNDWKAAGKNVSAFNVSDVDCWNYGEKGHVSRNCTKPSCGGGHSA